MRCEIQCFGRKIFYKDAIVDKLVERNTLINAKFSLNGKSGIDSNLLAWRTKDCTSHCLSNWLRVNRQHSPCYLARTNPPHSRNRVQGKITTQNGTYSTVEHSPAFRFVRNAMEQARPYGNINKLTTEKKSRRSTTQRRKKYLQSSAPVTWS